jgi:heat shock protein HspQ
MATPPRKRSTAVGQQITQDAPKAAPVKVAKSAPPKVAAIKPAKVVAKPVSKAAKPVAARPVAPRPVALKPVAPRSAAAVAAKPKPATTKASAKTAAKTSATPNGPRHAKFSVGAVVKHRVYPFRGVVFDIDPVFNNTEDWWQAIPEEIRPRKDQPFYHLLAENAETTYVAYVSEQNLLADKTGQPVRHPQLKEMFALDEKGQYRARFLQPH